MMSYGGKPGQSWRIYFFTCMSEFSLVLPVKIACVPQGLCSLLLSTLMSQFRRDCQNSKGGRDIPHENPPPHHVDRCMLPPRVIHWPDNDGGDIWSNMKGVLGGVIDGTLTTVYHHSWCCDI